MGCRHWLAESAQGAALQLYLALIAALLLQLYTGTRPNRRLMELLQFCALGWASVEEVMAGVRREAERKARREKSKLELRLGNVPEQRRDRSCPQTTGDFRSTSILI